MLTLKIEPVICDTVCFYDLDGFTKDFFLGGAFIGNKQRFLIFLSFIFTHSRLWYLL